MRTIIQHKSHWLQLFSLLLLTIFFSVTPTKTNADAPTATRTVCASGCDYTSIQAAINAASSGDTIALAAETFTEVGITVNKNLTIRGVAAADTIVQAHASVGSATDRVFFINSGVTATIENIAVRHGNSSSVGGGIYNSGTLTVNNSIIYDNEAIGSGGGIANMFGDLTVNNSTFYSNSAGIHGGGIHNRPGSNLHVNNSTIRGNSAARLGGGINNSDNLTVKNSTISSNSGSEGDGIFQAGGAGLSLFNTIIANNGGEDCKNNGGAIDSAVNNLIELTGSAACNISGNGNIIGQDPNLGPLQDNGGPTLTQSLGTNSPAINAGDNATCFDTDQRGIPRPQGSTCDIGAFEVVDCATYSFPVSVTDAYLLNTAIDCYNAQTDADSYIISFDSDITLNTATTEINNANANIELVIAGNGHALDGDDTYRGLTIVADTHVTINDLTIQNAHASGSGLDNDGGGILNSGTLTVNNGTFSGNSAARAGGGIINKGGGTLTMSNSTLRDNVAGDGGGIFNDGTLTVGTSTFHDNQASDNGNGGGIQNGGMLTVSNSTFSGNIADFDGGGIDNRNTLTMINSTLSGNAAGNFGGGIMNIGATLHLHNTIIANSTGRDCRTDSGVASATHNLIEDSGNDACGLSDGADGNIIGHPAHLGLLQNNGSSTETHALLIASPAIDAGDNTTCASVEVNNLDQRGIVRPQGATCDIGAVEACHAFLSGVVSTASFNEAISCYNAFTTSGSYVISLTANISLTTATMVIDNTTEGVKLVIAGNGYNLDGNNSYRGLTIAADTDVTINNLTIQNGHAIGEGADGGGIFNNGTLTINNSTLNGNTASDDGGGIYNDGVLRVNNSTLSDNTATNDSGGGINNRDTLTVNNSTLSGNVAGSGFGSGIINLSATLHLHNTIIANNTGRDCRTNNGVASATHNFIEDSGSDACGLTDGTDGNIIGQDPLLGPLADNGGSTQTHALLADSPAIDAGDNAICAGADVNNFDQRGIARPQSSRCDIGAYELECDFFPFDVATTKQLNRAIGCFNNLSTVDGHTISVMNDITLNTATVAINNVTPDVELIIEGNGHVLDGNDTYRGLTIEADTDVTIKDLTIQNGHASTSGADGGGILNDGTLTVSDSTFSGNTANDDGGAIDNDGTLTVSNSTFNDNTATNDDGGAIDNDNTLTVSNSTFSNNSAASAGGAIINKGGDSLTIINSTFSDNSASEGGGIFNDGTLTLHNTIIANSTGGDCHTNNATIPNATHNLIEDSGNDACGLTDNIDGNIIGQDPLLNALADNGGSTQTHALSSSSRAINAGDNAICADALINNLDQRGVARPQGATCDIGAYEFEGVPTAVGLGQMKGQSSAETLPLLLTFTLLLLSSLHLHHSKRP